MTSNRPVRVLIVEDSVLERQMLTRIIEREPDMTVVAAAGDAFEARDHLVRLRPDVVSLDVNLPRMDGLAFLRKYMGVLPTPTVIVSAHLQSDHGLERRAREAGAVDVVPKPGQFGTPEFQRSAQRIVDGLKRAAAFRMTRKAPGAKAQVSRQIVALGASTGGVHALTRVLSMLSADLPGVVIGQHMPPGFTKTFTTQLERVSQLNVVEAEAGMLLSDGVAIVAPSNDRHMYVKRSSGGGFEIAFKDGPKVCFQRPSIDVLFESVALVAGTRSTAALLTGMGDDGARGLLRIRQAGGQTLAEDESTCVVFGMPKAAQELGAAQQMVPLGNIAQTIYEKVKKQGRGES